MPIFPTDRTARTAVLSAALIGAALVVPWSPAPAAAQDAGVPAGVYVFVPEQSEEIEEAIDETVSQLSWVIRGFARRRLRGANQPIDTVRIEYPGDTVRITLRAADGPIPSPRSGEFVPYTRPDGEVVRVKTELGAGVITQFFDSEDGQKQMVYRLRDDGLLELVSTIYSERLDEPFEYVWVYRPAGD